MTDVFPGRRGDLALRKAAFLGRVEEYRSLGYDRFAAAEFAVDAAGRFSGPALDLGTGKGFLAQALARRGFPVVTVDNDADEQSLARFLAEEAGRRSIHFVRGDGARLPLAEARFGCVAAMDILHHLEEPEPVLEEAARVLLPGGTMILADFSPEGFELVARVHRREGRDHPVSGATLESAAAFLAERGFALETRLSGQCHEVAVLKKR